MNSNKIHQIIYGGDVASNGEAKLTIKKPGDVMLVKRGRNRSMVMKCPCGCGDDLVVNLDSRSGPAWRFYLRKGKVTIFPSIWRETGCESHFIIWNNKIYWCDYDSLWDEDYENPELNKLVLQFLEKMLGFSHYKTIADDLDEIPWTVLDSCRVLVKKNLVVEGAGKKKGQFAIKREPTKLGHNT